MQLKPSARQFISEHQLTANSAGLFLPIPNLNSGWTQTHS